ncbi:cytochrome c [Granulicella sp. WH15]|nr:cytochrome c [Granulicella sp. WH15]
MSSKYISRFALAVGAFLLIFVAAAQAQTAPTQQAAQKRVAQPQKSEQVHSEGERIFAQNCSRCHTAPDGFSPRISGTVVRHMRVRAQLSQHDEEELLRFFNP